MKLSVRRFTKNKMVTIELSTTDFSEKENSMLDQLGEPVIEIDKNYGQNPIKFSKKIRTGFKVKVRFDANLEENTDVTATYIESFIEFLQDEMSLAMSQLEFDYTEELIPQEVMIEIEY